MANTDQTKHSQSLAKLLGWTTFTFEGRSPMNDCYALQCQLLFHTNIFWVCLWFFGRCACLWFFGRCLWASCFCCFMGVLRVLYHCLVPFGLVDVDQAIPKSCIDLNLSEQTMLLVEALCIHYIQQGPLLCTIGCCILCIIGSLMVYNRKPCCIQRRPYFI